MATYQIKETRTYLIEAISQKEAEDKFDHMDFHEDWDSHDVEINLKENMDPRLIPPPYEQRPLFVILYDTPDGNEEYYAYFSGINDALKRFEETFPDHHLIGIAQMVAYAKEDEG